MLEELVIRMRTEIVSFSFMKKNGEIRKAKGTLRSDLCPTSCGGGRPTPKHLQLYFDVEKDAWRCFNKEQFIEMY